MRYTGEVEEQLLLLIAGLKTVFYRHFSPLYTLDIENQIIKTKLF
jgi:hypothetical protein